FTFDHHLDGIEWEGYGCSNPIAASTCEIIYEIFKSLGDANIDDKIAQCLYVGIVTDSSRFMTSNMTPHVHEIAAHLLTYPSVVVDKIYENLYGSFRFSRMKLVGHLLCHCMRTIKGYKVAYIFLSFEDSNRYKIYPGDTEGIVNYALSIKNVSVAAMFKEKEDGTYISFRSIGDFAVNEFSIKYFGGGGHKNAAGGSSKMSLQNTISKFEETIKNYDELKYVEQ
ncbi:MAG: bifunctional oligoribonuclease/PAP phosphatase NrnA, partial [Cytophagales bacterium]|nr:bifunctional oligoribonuclease/PAP phosphatase NrnA [Cytophagales bacterium]